MDLEGRVAVVTGAGSGLGRATAHGLARAGAHVALVDLDRPALDAVAAELDEAPDVAGESLVLALDVTDADAALAAADQVTQRWGALHVTVNCAGIAPAAKVVGRRGPADLEQFTRTLAVNLVGTFNLTRVTVAKMLDNEPDHRGERGVVVNTASDAAFDGQMGQAGYSASKAGVVGMTLPLARDLAGTGVRVNTIAPGLFETSLTAGFSDQVRDRLLDMILEPRRLGDPAEFAALVRHVVENPYLNAECIRLDAGQRMLPR